MHQSVILVCAAIAVALCSGVLLGIGVVEFMLPLGKLSRAPLYARIFGSIMLSLLTLAHIIGYLYYGFFLMASLPVVGIAIGSSITLITRRDH